MILIQLSPDATDSDVEEIYQTADHIGFITDNHEYSTKGTYIAFMVFVYGFLTIIALVSLLNIINSISMSVSARIKQYGAMRAVGMSARQVTKMITVEALTCGKMVTIQQREAFTAEQLHLLFYGKK